MPRALPRPLVGLAASALAVGLLMAPMIAYADPTPTPTPKTTAAAKSTPSPSPSPSRSSGDPTATSPSADASETPAAAPTSESASPSPSSDDSAASDDASPTPSPDASSTAPGRVGSDAVAAPSPTASESESSPVRAQAVEPAGISLIKSASRTSVSKVGQVITYTFVAKNTGGVALTGVVLTDQLSGLKGPSCPASTLPVGESFTCTATLTVTQDWMDFGSIDNSATVFGSYTLPEGGGTDYVGANASAHVSITQKPAIAIDASVSPTGTADKGDRLHYTATATNTGNVTLTSARITSSRSKLDFDCDPSARATLAPGESITCDGSYKVTTADARRGRVSNKLTALANGPYDDQRPSDSVTLRTKVTKITSSSDSDSGLADTGGPDGALPVGLLGVAALVGGAALVRRGRRA